MLVRSDKGATFLTTHPECMSGDFEILIDKITYLTSKIYQQKASKKKKRAEQVKTIARRNIKRAESHIDDSQSTKSRRSKRNRREPSTEEYTEEEYSN